MRIRTKTGAITPFIFNRAQQHIHTHLEEQKARTGKVRALILKGRQQGCSTYVGARFFHVVTQMAGYRSFILTHEQPATDNLFEVVQRFHENLPNPPPTSTASSKELIFSELDSGYRVATAGQRGAGRSATVQLFHGSEVGFWPFAETHAAGVLQAVASEPGTECILESTANGMGNFFHKSWRDAETGVSDYVAVFVPWYWQDEYRKPVPPDFRKDSEEIEYAENYRLDDEQMAWRRQKIAELRDPILFKQEYPATSAEAFQTSGHDSFIPATLIAKARAGNAQGSGPLVIGFDPAWKGPDRSAMAFRRGREVLKIETRRNIDTMEAAGWVKLTIDKEKPARVFIDVGGIGAGIVDRCKEYGEPYSRIVVAVNFGSTPHEPPPVDAQGRQFGGPLNRRAEMWLKSKEWLADVASVKIPDMDSLQADACAPAYKYDSLTRLVLESKEDIRRRGLASPDLWDAVALTFAEPVADYKPRSPRPRRLQGGWMAV